MVKECEIKFVGFFINNKKRTKMYNAFEELKKNFPEFENIRHNLISHTICKTFGSAPAHQATLTNCLYKRDPPLVEKEYRNCSMELLIKVMLGTITYEPYYLICEDDFCISNERYYKKFLRDFNKIKVSSAWDVILLTHFGNNTYFFEGDTMNNNNFLRNKKNTNTSAYIVKKSMLIKIINCFEEAIKDPDYTNDLSIFSFKNYWIDLQESSNFYIYNREFAGVNKDINEDIIRFL